MIKKAKTDYRTNVLAAQLRAFEQKAKIDWDWTDKDLDYFRALHDYLERKDYDFVAERISCLKTAEDERKRVSKEMLNRADRCSLEVGRKVERAGRLGVRRRIEKFKAGLTERRLRYQTEVNQLGQSDHLSYRQICNLAARNLKVSSRTIRRHTTNPRKP